MKRICVILLIVFTIIILFNNQNDNDELRFRIIANSDEVIDQNLKYRIARELHNENINPNNLDILKDKVEYIVLSNNFNYQVNVCIRNEYFETKYYNDKIIQGGTYKTIVVTLGEGKGKNYWTILYPQYFNASFEDVNTGNVSYDIWILKKIKEWFN